MDPIGRRLAAGGAERGGICQNATALMRMKGQDAYRVACERSRACRSAQDHRSAEHWRMVAHEIGRRSPAGAVRAGQDA